MKTNKRNSKRVSREEHEAKCRCCGKCCRKKIQFGDGQSVAFRDLYCEYFDRKTMMCLVYAWRFKAPKANGMPCQTIQESKVKGLLPMDCAYVADDPEYKTKIDTWE